ncbi:PIN domain-containing protein [Streptomyces sp. NPDC094447]|uniref:PIN domain-containing protein n=1 Tax=Streptomyces sp. NPDC094447 TaxID=3366062 RepID=UPI003828B99F
MIILDTCVIRGMRLDGSEADVLRAIVRTKTERVGAPWMAIEELAAQKALEYQDAHRVAARALRQLQNKSHQVEPKLGEADLEGVREKWRKQYRGLVEVLPTSEAALREGMYREANTLPPAAMKGEGEKRVKVGARDVAIWLSAVEYARGHPKETVYFVSSNHKDFTKGGASYPSPMNVDLEGLEGRFRHLTNLGDVLALVAPRVTADGDEVRDLLTRKHTKWLHKMVQNVWGHHNAPKPFPVMTQAGTVEEATQWLTTEDLPVASLVDVSDIDAYRLGDEEYYVVTARWQIAGYTAVSGRFTMAACYWDTRLIVSMEPETMHAQLLNWGTLTPVEDAAAVDWPTSYEARKVARDILNRATDKGGKMTWAATLLTIATAMSMSTADRQHLIDELRLSTQHIGAALEGSDDASTSLLQEDESGTDERDDELESEA